MVGGDGVAAGIAAFVGDHPDAYDVIAATQDWHEPHGTNHHHFAADHHAPDLRTTWPHHCVMGTPGADYHPALAPILPLFTGHFRKGMGQAAYSGFEGVDGQGTPLADWLRSAGVHRLHVVGIATDYCVKATVLDGIGHGFATTLVLDLTTGVAGETSVDAIADMIRAGAQVEVASRVLAGT